jgi:predicted amidohydrolase
VNFSVNIFIIELMKVKNKFIAATVQAAPVFLNKGKTIKKVISLMNQAAKKKADLVVFPEAFIPTYPFWPKDLGFGPEKKITMDLHMELHKNSVEVPGPDTKKMGQAAKKARINVIIGVNEKEGGTLYNTILYFSKSGELIGRHRKLMSIDSERCIWGNGTSEDLKVFDTELGKVSGLFCYEHHLTLAKYALYNQGEQIHASLWGGHGFVKNTMDFAFPLKEQTLWDYPGGSGIINPRGQYIAGPVFDKEEILYAEIDHDQIIRAKTVIDCSGHFSRPDIFKFEIKDS